MATHPLRPRLFLQCFLESQTKCLGLTNAKSVVGCHRVFDKVESDSGEWEAKELSAVKAIPVASLWLLAQVNSNFQLDKRGRRVSRARHGGSIIIVAAGQL